jgi:CDP-glucose 4,6-dehydratase
MFVTTSNPKSLGSGKLLITGHTGFKGSWLTLLANQMGIRTVGVALPPHKDSLFNHLQFGDLHENHFIDVRNADDIARIIAESQPMTLIHLAAQPLVLESYEYPKETFEVNALGTLNILEAASNCVSTKSILIITTDKVYQNKYQAKRFVETDALEGRDPYSASKVAAEAVTRAWRTLNELRNGPKVLIARAGNVIGGGDLSPNRLIPDIVRAHILKTKVEVRNGNATRPWQHVLDPLMGYLSYLDASLTKDVPPVLNFGPAERSKNVNWVVSQAAAKFHSEFQTREELTRKNLESLDLDLDSTLAATSIGWKARWTQEEAVRKTFIWWDAVLNKSASHQQMCLNDINAFFESQIEIE